MRQVGMYKLDGKQFCDFLRWKVCRGAGLFLCYQFCTFSSSLLMKYRQKK